MYKVLVRLPLCERQTWLPRSSYAHQDNRVLRIDKFESLPHAQTGRFRAFEALGLSKLIRDNESRTRSAATIVMNSLISSSSSPGRLKYEEHVPELIRSSVSGLCVLAPLVCRMYCFRVCPRLKVSLVSRRSANSAWRQKRLLRGHRRP